jgi:hypothetical protein
MYKIIDVVRDIVLEDEEILLPMVRGYINLSAYAKRIRAEVESRTKKQVKVPSIVVSLSRVRVGLGRTHPLVVDVKINNVTVKSPISEIVFEKTPKLLQKLSALYSKVKTAPDDFLTMTLSTSEATVICSDRIKGRVLSHFGEKPRMIEGGLAAIGLSLDPKYYPMPNITFSLIRRIAQKRIPLAETITTHTEIIFVFNQKHLATMVELFQPK